MAKISSLLKVVVAFLFAFAISFNVVTGEALALGDFSQTCYGSSISNATLSSTCAKADGYTQSSTSIDLNSIVENVDGVLKFQPDNFAETCRGISLSGGSNLTAECKRRNQSWNSTSLDLDNCIANINGVLKNECF